MTRLLPAPLKIGFIGAGAVAEHHLGVLGTLPGVEISAVCDLDWCDRYRKTLFDFDKYRMPQYYGLIAECESTECDSTERESIER